MTAPISGSGNATSTAPLPILGSAANTTGSASSTSADPLGAGGQALDENAFVQMLVAQMKNQDPMNPMDGTQLATQLAQFSSVEQLIKLNTNVTSASTATQQAANTTLGVSLIGHDVIVPGNTIDANAGEVPQATLDVPAGTASLTITVLDSSGKTVGTQTVTNPATGRQAIDLSSTITKPGSYSYQVQALDANKNPVNVTTYATARVQGMSTSNGDVEVQINGVMTPISQIVEIIAPTMAPVAPTPTSTTTTNPTTTPGATS
jgi:flagellar basal-body rod modification protein FlgD